MPPGNQMDIAWLLLHPRDACLPRETRLARAYPAWKAGVRGEEILGEILWRRSVLANASQDCRLLKPIFAD